MRRGVDFAESLLRGPSGAEDYERASVESVRRLGAAGRRAGQTIWRLGLLALSSGANKTNKADEIDWANAEFELIY